ncbi:hypothetical protein CKAH01_12596 [Colletotrichum kahawae]|uniref:Uncharacterized protein n=1 Tax=Colletotrichum kahawae TaxID=34407 RepID=A0AAD9YSE4_COLKA|nr:hypothetical protein CKAH01_12596 [Colletotrichum kahawae]
MEMVLFICALWKKSPWALDKGGTSNKSGLDWTGLDPKETTLHPSSAILSPGTVAKHPPLHPSNRRP